METSHGGAGPESPRRLEVVRWPVRRPARREPRRRRRRRDPRVRPERALANGPKILLADEPTAALDANGTAAVVEAFELARTSFGAALVVATHDPDVAGIAPTRYRLDDGALTRVP